MRDLAPVGQVEEVIIPDNDFCPGEGMVAEGRQGDAHVEAALPEEVPEVEVLPSPMQQGEGGDVEHGEEGKPPLAKEQISLPEPRRSSRVSRPPQRLITEV